MDIETALRIVGRQAPCPHDNADAGLGNGQVWARCNDCSATFPQDLWERARAAAIEFAEALETLRNAVGKEW
jgi:hypothetical protein